MSEDPQSPEPRNKLPKETKAGRAFPMLAPAIIVAVALLLMLLLWLPQR